MNQHESAAPHTGFAHALLVIEFAFVAAFCGCTTTPKVDATTHATLQTPPLKVGVYADRGPGGIGAVDE